MRGTLAAGLAGALADDAVFEVAFDAGLAAAAGFVELAGVATAAGFAAEADGAAEAADADAGDGAADAAGADAAGFAAGVAVVDVPAVDVAAGAAGRGGSFLAT